MPSLPPNIRRNALVRALKRCGFRVVDNLGKGSHYKAYSLDRKRSITVPKSLESPKVRSTIGAFIAEDVDFDDFLETL